MKYTWINWAIQDFLWSQMLLMVGRRKAQTENKNLPLGPRECASGGEADKVRTWKVKEACGLVGLWTQCLGFVVVRLFFPQTVVIIRSHSGHFNLPF